MFEVVAVTNRLDSRKIRESHAAFMCTRSTLQAHTALTSPIMPHTGRSSTYSWYQ